MLKYSTTISSRGYLYKELKIAANNIINGINLDELQYKIVKENIYFLESEKRKKEISSEILKRISVLNINFISLLLSTNLNTSKQIGIYTIYKTDKLFMEFMDKVYKEKIKSNYLYIENKDFQMFFRKKSEEVEQIKNWSEVSKDKLIQSYKKILLDSDFAKKSEDKLKINLQILSYRLENELIKNSDFDFINTIRGSL